ncbi:Acg family FMN-binding oxidoreductase [Halorhodospira neutriphila]|uniref:Acg family FMN-binding oxidoreductase n=1 Tax=Halorhodospira neutriphila TaxID=168379 RepID=UPI0030846D46
MDAYEAALQRVWRPVQAARGADRAALLRELVRCAALAPSGHNTQCWRFRLEAHGLAILPDWSRRTPVVDPDDHHLYVSLGCAAENLCQAARALGWAASAEPVPEGQGGAIRILLEPAEPAVSALSRAIPHRQCTRAVYDGRALAVAELRRLEGAAGGGLSLVTGRGDVERTLECIVDAGGRQIRDPAFVAELERWIRFSDREAVRTGDGLAARAVGSPPVPRWLGRRLFRALLRPGPEGEKYARWVRSSAGLAVFCSAGDDWASWVEAGRRYQRFALQATAMGIRTAFLNQPVEAPEVRPELAAALGLGGVSPDLVVRFGRGPRMPRSLRRPVEAVLMPAGEGPAV